jgi:hypothetical protein
MVRGEFVKRLCEGLETSHIARRRPNPVKSAIRSADGVGVQRSISPQPGQPTLKVSVMLAGSDRSEIGDPLLLTNTQ